MSSDNFATPKPLIKLDPLDCEPGCEPSWNVAIKGARVHDYGYQIVKGLGLDEGNIGQVVGIETGYGAWDAPTAPAGVERGDGCVFKDNRDGTGHILRQIHPADLVYDPSTGYVYEAGPRLPLNATSIDEVCARVRASMEATGADKGYIDLVLFKLRLGG